MDERRAFHQEPDSPDTQFGGWRLVHSPYNSCGRPPPPPFICLISFFIAFSLLSLFMVYIPLLITHCFGFQETAPAEYEGGQGIHGVAPPSRAHG